MEHYNPNNPKYIPTDVSANDLIVDAMRTIYQAGSIVRDF